MSKHLFVSVGSRFPMDRLINAVDLFLAKHPNFTAFAQVGLSQASTQHLTTQAWLDESVFQDKLSQSDIFISHAGMGNILLAATKEKPIILMPRQSALEEHINDHQIDTANQIKQGPFSYVVSDFEELETAILSITSETIQENANNADMTPHRQQLISAVRLFIDEGKIG